MHLLCGSSRAMKRAHGGWQRRNSMALHPEENKVPLRQSPKCKWIIARVVGSEIATTKGNVTASWRQRNLRSGWRVRQYDLTTSLRQRWRRAISQWIGVILYGFQTRSRRGRSRCVSYAVLSYLWKRTRCACCRLMQSPWNGARHSKEPATLLNERTNQKIQIFNYVVGMKRCISLFKSASHSATLSFQPTLTEKKSLVY